MTRDGAGAPRGALVLYAIAFCCVLAAAAFIGVAVRNLLAERTPMWISVWCSAAAIVAAAAGLLVSRRR